MFAEYLSFTITFIISAGLAVMGILVSFQLYQHQKHPVFINLLYQQIFLISFFAYGIWGNIALREILADVEINPLLEAKLAIFLPLLGLPFLIVSWFMLLKFGLLANGYNFGKNFASSYFAIFLLVIIAFAASIQNGFIPIPGDADLFIVRIILLVNLLIHLFFSGSFLKPKINPGNLPVKVLERKTAILYFAGVLSYSVLTFFFNFIGFISICLSIVLLFAVSVFIPVNIRISWINKREQPTKNIDFEAFCQLYEISKREAEIVREICSGKSNKAIAETLFISLQTVKDHTHRIYFKTGVNSRIQLSNLVREKTGVAEF